MEIKWVQYYALIGRLVEGHRPYLEVMNFRGGELVKIGIRRSEVEAYKAAKLIKYVYDPDHKGKIRDINILD